MAALKLSDEEQALIALARLLPDGTSRLIRALNPGHGDHINDAQKLVREVFRYTVGRTTESLVLVVLDRRCRVIGSQVLTTGTACATIVDARHVLTRVIAYGDSVSSFAIGHNHPSGDPDPSVEDQLATRRLSAAANLLGLKLLDHVIVTDDPDVWVSMMERGAM